MFFTSFSQNFYKFLQVFRDITLGWLEFAGEGFVVA